MNINVDIVKLKRKTEELIKYFRSNKLGDHWEGISSCPFSTAYVLIAYFDLLRKSLVHSSILKENIGKMINFLSTVQNKEGSWGKKNLLLEEFWITPFVYSVLSIIENERKVISSQVVEKVSLMKKRALAYIEKIIPNSIKILNIPKELLEMNLLAGKLLCDVFECDYPLKFDFSYNEKSLLELAKRGWSYNVTNVPSADYIIPYAIINDDREYYELYSNNLLKNGSIGCITHYSAAFVLGNIFFDGNKKLLKKTLKYLNLAQNRNNHGFPQFYNYETFITVYPLWLMYTLHRDSVLAQKLANIVTAIPEWTLKNQKEDGSWSFTKDFLYGDADDTCCALGWLLASRNLTIDSSNAIKAKQFLMNNLNSNNAISSWQNFPHMEPDVAARALSVLSDFESEKRNLELIVESLIRMQQSNGSWKPAWHLSNIHGTFYSLLALEHFLDLEDKIIEKARNFMFKSAKKLLLDDKRINFEDTALLLVWFIKDHGNAEDELISKLANVLISSNITEMNTEQNWLGVYSYGTSTFSHGTALAALMYALNYIKH